MDALEPQLEEPSLTANEAEAFARGLYAVAVCDGLHERETALIASFLGEGAGRAGALAELARGPVIAPEELARLLDNPEKRALFLKTSLLLSWADGKVSDEEKTIVAAFAQALAITEGDRKKMEEQVKEYLLSHLSHIQNSEAVADVAKELGV